MNNDFREYSAAFYSQSDIYHYGVKGMKWGVIRWKDKINGILKKYTQGVAEKRDSRKDKVLDLRSIINIGNKTLKDNSYRNTVNNLTNKYDYENKWAELYNKNPTSNAAKRWLEKSTDEFKKAIINFGNYEKYSNNCPSCALAVEMKKRGMDVKPKGGFGLTAKQCHDVYVGEKTKTCKSNRDFWQSANYGKPGDHGTIIGMYNKYGGGHTLNYTVLKGGKVQIEDAQSGEVMSLEDAKRNYASMQYFQYGEILNLTKAEIDMDQVRQFNMVDTSSYKNGNDMKLRQYEQSVKKYLKSRKKYEGFLLKILKALGSKQQYIKR